MKNLPLFTVHADFRVFMLCALLIAYGATGSAQYELVYENHEPNLTQPWAIADDGLNNSYLAGVFEVTLTLGSFTLTSSGRTGFVGRFNSSSNTWLWAKKITQVSSGSGQQTLSSYPEVFDVVIDDAGNVYITGDYSGVVSFDNISLSSTKQGNQYTQDIFVAKYNTNGDIVWAKSFGSKAGFDRAKTIALDGSDNIFIAGVFTNKVVSCNGFSVDKFDVYLAKLNNAGTALWENRYASPSFICPYNNSGESLSTDASGNVFLAGTFAGTLSFGSGTGLSITSINETVDVFAAKIDGNGTTQWVQAAGSGSRDYGETIYADASGNVFTGGRFEKDAFLIKYNSTGNLEWSVNPFPVSPDFEVTSISRITPYSNSILVNNPFIGFKMISPADGSVISSDSLIGNTFGGASIWDVAVAGSGYVFNVMGECGTVTIGSTPLVSTNDCPYNGNDIFIVRTGSEEPSCPDADSDGVCDDDDVCPGFNDNLIGTACNDGNECTMNDVYLGAPECGCAGTAIPDCVPCNPQTASLTPNPLTHTGTGASSTNTLSLSTGSFDVSLSITGLDAKLNGKANGRYIDRVQVWYNPGTGEQLYGTYNGDQQSTVQVSITGTVQSVRVTLEDGYDGNSSVTQSISFSGVTYCSGGMALTGETEEGGTIATRSNRQDSEMAFEVFPNPATDQLHVTLPAREKETTLFIQNQFGHTVWSEKFEAQRSTATISLDVHNFHSGIYYLVFLSNGEVETKRVVISR